jgi:hypothetical protein
VTVSGAVLTRNSLLALAALPSVFLGAGTCHFTSAPNTRYARYPVACSWLAFSGHRRKQIDRRSRLAGVVAGLNIPQPRLPPLVLRRRLLS